MNYHDITTALATGGADSHPAELHGMVSAFVCRAIERDEQEDYLRMLTGRAGLRAAAALRDAATDLHDDTRRALAAGSFEFRLLLPPDAAGIAERAMALGEWCQGFALALTHGNETVLARLDDDAREVLQDIIMIGGAHSSAEEQDDEERALMELEEYVRVGVSLLYEDLTTLATLEANH